MAPNSACDTQHRGVSHPLYSLPPLPLFSAWIPKQVCPSVRRVPLHGVRGDASGLGVFLGGPAGGREYPSYPEHPD